MCFLPLSLYLCIICFAELAGAATLERVEKDLTITSTGTSSWPQIDPSAARCMEIVSLEPLGVRIGWPAIDRIVAFKGETG